MNQLEVLFFFDKLRIFPTGGGRENTNQKNRIVGIFNFQSKNENKR